jgi:hypothetical protein
MRSGENPARWRGHRVPLSDRAMAVLKIMLAVRCSEFVFSGMNVDRPLSVMR